MLKASSRLLAVAIGLLATTRSASAQPAPVEPAGPGLDIGLGIRGGVSVDADAFYGGVHANIDGIGGIADLRIEPVLEVGHGEEDSSIGDFGYWLVRLAGNVKYFFPLNAARDVRVHGSGGVSLYYARADDCDVGDRFDELCDDTQGGVTLGGGLEVKRFGIDAYVGLGDIPDFTVTGMVSF
jgi:hypothetical protein